MEVGVVGKELGDEDRGSVVEDGLVGAGADVTHFQEEFSGTAVLLAEALDRLVAAAAAAAAVSAGV